jgi:hypothetical protein
MIVDLIEDEVDYELEKNPKEGICDDEDYEKINMDE